MLFLNSNKKNLDQYNNKYFLNCSIDSKILTIEFLKKESLKEILILKQKLEFTNLEQLLDFFDCMISNFSSMRDDILIKKNSILYNLDVKQKERVIDLPIDKSKDFIEQINLKIENLILND